MALVRYDIEDRERPGHWAEHFWSPVNAPVTDADGHVLLIVHRVEEVTELIRARGASDGGRARETQRRQVAAALAGPRASAALLALLPLAGVALAAGLGARPLHVLLHTPLGVGCLLLGAALDLLGLWWTTRIVARAAQA